MAHLGYFERAYVQQRGWLTSDEYGSVVALCQMLPGPASSQVGFLIGGLTVNIAYWDVYYFEIVLLIALERLTDPALTQGAAAPARALSLPPGRERSPTA